MTFDEFKEQYDLYNAYNDWTTVEIAKYMKYLPEDYHDVFDNLCECGSENIITKNLTQITCCNPNCKVKQGFKLAKLMSSFSMDGVGPAICDSVYRRITCTDAEAKARGEEGLLKTSSYLEMLIVPYDKYPFDLRTAAGENFFRSAAKVLNTQVTFPKLIGMLGLKGFGGNSETFFKDINSYAELKKEIIEKGGIQKFCASRGAYAPIKSCDLKVALPDIILADFLFRDSIRATGLQALDICITGSIKLHGKSITKAEFINKCNELCVTEDGVQLYEVKMNAAVEHNPFILYSTPSSSSKFKKGMARGEVTDTFGTHPVLMTADDFYSLLEEKVKKLCSKFTMTKEVGTENVAVCESVASFQ